MSRPTKFKPEFTQMLKDYMDEPEKMGDKIPMVQTLARMFDVHRDTIQSWGKNEANSEDLVNFSVMYGHFKDSVERAVLNLGFSNIASNFCQFYLKSKCGYVEKQHIEHAVHESVDRQILDNWESEM